MAHKSDKSVALKQWAETVGQNMEMFKEGCELVVRDHQKSNVKTSSFAIHLSHMSARENSAPIKSTLEVLSHRLDATEAERLKVLAQLQALVVNKFQSYPGDLKVVKASIDRRNVSVNDYAKASNEYASASKSGNQEKLNIAAGHLKAAEKSMRGAEDILNNELGDFELKRVTDMRDWLKRYIRNQIYFHAKSIEGFTAAYQELVKIDPDTEKAIFLRRVREMEFQDVRRPSGLSLQPGASGSSLQPAASALQSPAAIPAPAASPAASPAAATAAR